MTGPVRTLKNLFFEKLPIYLIFYVTSRCNFRCPFCFYLDNIEEKVKNELTLDEIEKISRGFGYLVQLSLTGGEPFLRKELPEICGIFIRNNAARYITIPTNGSLPERVEEVVNQLITTHPRTGFRIPISIDGIDADHDAMRRVPGSFEKLKDTYRRLIPMREKHNNLIIDVNTTFSTANQEKVPSIIEWVMKNMDVDNHSITYIRGNVRDQTMMKASASQYRKCVEMLKSRPKRAENRLFSALIRSVIEESWDTIARTIETDQEIVPCVAGRKLVIVNEKGDVYPCEILGKTFGNLRRAEYNISKILFAKSSNDLKDWIQNTHCHCTFECAVNTNVVFRKHLYPKILANTLQIKGRFILLHNIIKSYRHGI